MSSLYMLDTDISSYLIRSRDPRLKARFQSVLPSYICISVIAWAELMYGLKGLPKHHRLHIDVPFFLNNVRVFNWDTKAAEHYGDIRHHLKSTGQPIGELDMMIAAHCFALGATLVTNNVRHYSRVHLPLRIENWMDSTEA